MSDLQGFLPFELVKIRDRWLVRWLDMGGYGLARGLLRVDISAALSAGAAQRLTNIDVLMDLPEHAPEVLILHQARCGSNLLMHLTASVFDWTAITEPSIINTILKSDMPMADKKSALRGAVSALVSRMGNSECPGLIKLSPWNMIHRDLFQALYPNVPFWFVFRDPRASMLSMMDQPSHRQEYADGPLPWLEGAECAQAVRQSRQIEERLAMMLAQWQKDALPQTTRHGTWQPRLFHYPDLAKQIRQIYPELATKAWDENTEAHFQHHLSIDSHRPQRAFAGPRSDKNYPAKVEAAHALHSYTSYQALLEAYQDQRRHQRETRR